MTDRTTRLIALSALALALVAVVIAGYALHLALASRTEVDELRSQLAGPDDGFPPLPLDGPPPTLDTDQP